jgi:hypothetical protein
MEDAGYDFKAVFYMKRMCNRLLFWPLRDFMKWAGVTRHNAACRIQSFLKSISIRSRFRKIVYLRRKWAQSVLDKRLREYARKRAAMFG